MQEDRDDRSAPIPSRKDASGDLATPSLYAAAILLAVVLVYFTFSTDVPSEIETAATNPGVELSRTGGDEFSAAGGSPGDETGDTGSGTVVE